MLTIIVGFDFEDGKFYPQVFFDDALYELQKFYNTKKLSQKELTLIKQMHQKNVFFVIIGILKMLDLNLNCMFVINVMF